MVNARNSGSHQAMTRVCTTPSRSPVEMAGSYSPSVKSCSTRAFASGSSGLRQSFSAETSPAACGPFAQSPAIQWSVIPPNKSFGIQSRMYPTNLAPETA